MLRRDDIQVGNNVMMYADDDEKVVLTYGTIQKVLSWTSFNGVLRAVVDVLTREGVACRWIIRVMEGYRRGESKGRKQHKKVLFGLPNANPCGRFA